MLLQLLLLLNIFILPFVLTHYPDTNGTFSSTIKNQKQPPPSDKSEESEQSFQMCIGKDCPPTIFMAMFLFSPAMNPNAFNGIRKSLASVLTDCINRTHVGIRLLVKSINDTSSLDQNDHESIDDQLDHLKLSDYIVRPRLNKPKFAFLLMSAIEQLKHSSGDNVDKFLLIVSDYNLDVRRDDAISIRIMMQYTHMHLRYLHLLPAENADDNDKSSDGADQQSTSMGDRDNHNAEETQLATLVNDEGQHIIYRYMNDDKDWKLDELALCPIDQWHNNTVVNREEQLPMNHHDGPPPTKPVIIIVAIIGGILLFLALLLLIFCIHRKNVRKWKRKVDDIRCVSQQRSHEPNMYGDMKSFDIWSIDESNLIIDTEHKLGAGAFCNVYRGQLIGAAPVTRIHPTLARSYVDCLVAVKMLPTYLLNDELARSDFIQEINFMKSLNYHPHLICMLGVSWHSSSDPRLITEYCARGDLLHLVREHADEIVHGYTNIDGIKLKDLVGYAWQISNGLEYLNSIGCIHRDVAARNILIDQMNLAKVAFETCDMLLLFAFRAQIGDFGLCRLMNSSLYTTRGGRLPIKWMALESLKSYEYSIKSDVWSYGVLLYELFSLGETPFALVQPNEMVAHLEDGNRLDQPTLCPNEIYELMCLCWSESIDRRPSFTDICERLTLILERATENYGYLQLSSAATSNENQLQDE